MRLTIKQTKYIAINGTSENLHVECGTIQYENVYLARSIEYTAHNFQIILYAS